MSTISGASSASSAWSGMSSARANSRADRMFSKVDTDGSGSVDKTELQDMLDNIAQKTGTSLGSADDLMSKMDTDGDGSLSKDELASGMKSLMPAPSSTVEFAHHGGGGGCHMPPPDSDSSGSTSTTATDPLDTNGDGVVSADELAAGQLKNAANDLFAAIDTNGDKSISKSEAETFKQNVDGAIQGMESAGSSSASGSQTSSSGDSSSNQALSSFIDLVLKQYSQTAAATASSGSADASLSVIA